MQHTMRTDHQIVFAHADLNLHNVFVKDVSILALLDWECAGWYPGSMSNSATRHATNQHGIMLVESSFQPPNQTPHEPELAT
jgi:Phosphotransferase enzyme family